MMFKVGFQVDDKQIKDSLSGIQNDLKNAFSVKSGNLSSELVKATEQAKILEQALKRATTDKGLSYYSLTSELNKAGTSASKLTATLAAGGEKFAASLNAANTALATADRSVISLNSKIKEMSRVLTQSFKFTAAQTFLQGVSNAAQEAYQWVYDLNKTVTDISIVTGYQGEQLDRVTQSAIQGAKELRIAANEYAQGALIFYQQGLNDDEVARRTEITVKAARAAGSSMEEMSSQLTAVWNTYKMTGDEMQRAASVGAKMAGDTAVDFADIAEAMQTAAAPAEQMGVSYNSLAAIIATVGDTTQQSASVIGNAFKTIFSRFQQLKSEGTDGEVTLNRVSSQLQELGVNVLDSSGELRQLDDVIMEVGNSWEGWSSKQQLAIAQLVGGTRQYGQFLTLMNNFDKYQNLLGSANMEDGSTLEQQYAASLDSIESHAQNAAESMRRAFGQLFDEDLLKGAFTTIEGIGDILGSIIQTLGGGVGIITQIAAALSSKVGPALANAAKNATLFVNNLSHSGRQANIDREFEENTKEYEARRAENRRTNESGQQEIADQELERSLNLQQQKNNFSHQTATINERINTLLKTATGEERIRLQIKQQNLKTAQEEYQIQLDNLNTLQKQLEQEERRLQLAKQRQVAEASQEVKKAKENEEKKTGNLNAAKERLEKADAAIENDKTNDESTMKKLLAEQEEAQKAYAQAQKEAAQATEERIAAENKLQQAVAQQKNTTNESVLSVNKMTAAYKTGNASATDLKEAMQTSGKAIIEQYNGIALALEDAGLTEQAQEARAEIERLTQAIDNLNGDDDDPFDDILSGLNNMANQLPEVTDEVRDLSSQTFESSSSLQQMGQRASNSDVDMPEQTRGRRLGSRVSSAVSSGLGKVSNFLQSNEQVISGITQIGTSAAATISTVQGMWDVLGNPDASIMEKVTSVGTGIASIVPNIMNVIDGFKMLPPQVAIATVAIGATIAAVAALWNEFQKYTAEAQFKRMSEAAAQLKSDAEEARSEADALKSSIESYDSARSALDNCTKGTEEWKDALAATNDAAQDVINSISDLEGVDLSNLYERDENGMLMLNQDELERIQGEADSLATQKEFAAQMAEINASQLGNQVTAKNIASEYTIGAGGAIAGGAATGAMIGSIAGPLGAAIGGIVGGLGGAITEDIQDAQIGEKIMENLDELTDLDTDDLRNKLSSFGMDVSNLSDTAIEQLRNRLQDLANSSAAAQEKLELIAGMAVDEQLGDAYSGEAKDVVSKQVAADQQRLTEEWSSFMDDNFSKVSDGSEENRNKLVDAFNTAMGTNYSAAGNFSQGTDGNRVFAFRNEVTGEIETFTKEYIASTIAAQQALEGLEVSAQEAETMLKNLSVTGEDGKKDEGATQAVRDFISSGNLDSATKGDFETLKQGVEDAGGAQQYLESIGFTPEIAEQYAADFEAALEIDWDSVTANLPESFKNAEELTLTQARGFGDTYQKIVGIAGEEAGKEYENMMNGILSQVTNEEDKSKMADILSGIDWTQWDAADKAAQAMEDMGYQIDTTSESWLNFTENMRETFKAIPDLDSLVAQLQQVKDIARGIELGSIISEEDYNTLTAYNNELSKYFMILADGSAQMMGDPLDFMQEVERTGQQALKDSITQYKQMQDELEGVSGSQNYQNSEGKNYYNGGNVQTQLDYIQASGTVDQSQIDAWRTDLEDGKSTVETINAIGEAFDQLGMTSEIAGAKAQQAMTELAMTASSAEERMQMLESGDIDEVAYAQASMSAINQEKWEGFSQEDIEGVEDYANHLQDVAKESELVSDELENNEEAAEDVARQVTKMNRGIEDLAEGFEDWSDILENSDKSSQEYSEAMDGMKSAMSDVLGVSEEFLSDDFILDNMEDIKLAAEGDAEAIDRLAIAAAKDIIIQMDIQDEGVREEVLGLHNELAAMSPNIEVGATLNTGDFYTKAQELVDTAGMSVEQAQAYFNSLGYEPVFEMRNETRTAPMYGKRVYTDSPVIETVEYGDGQVYPYIAEMTTHEEEVYMGEQQQNFVVPALTAEGTPKIKELRRTSSGAMNNFSGSNGGGGSPGGGGGKGGGGSAPKHQAKKAAKRDSLKVEDRYSTVQAAIDDVQRSLDKLDDTSSDMWGGPKLKALQKYNQELWNQADNYQTLLDLTEHYMDVDQEAANKAREEASKELGATLTGIKFNDDGFIANRTEIINQLDDLLQAKYDQYKTAADAYDAAQSTDEAESERIDKLKEDYDELEQNVNEYIKALDLSDETAQKHQETLNELVEMIRKEISNRVEIITYKIELQTDMNDLEMKQIERTIEHLGDVGVLTGDKIHLLSGAFKEAQQNASLAVSGFRQLEGLLGRLNTEAGQAEFIEKFGQEAWDQYAENGVLPEEIISGMESYVDSLMSSIDEMYSKMEDMFDTYLDLLDMYADKFDQIADKLSNNASKLDVYQELLEFSGQQYRVEDDGTHSGQEARRQIAAGRVSTTQANLENAKQQYDLYKEQYDEWMQNVEKFQDEHGADISNYDEATAAAWNKIEETRQELYNQMQESESEIYDNMSELVSNVADAIETGAQIITEQIVESLGGLFDSFESMTETWDQKETLRTFFLEDYDKNYQLESLLRDVDDAMADVTDPARMNEYLALIDEINAANAEGVKVTQNDVDLLKAKFELQKAQDAYEEAQNAKNTMRLARDASGNWNYVYSQDQSQSEDAAQALADAQYNYDKLLHEVRDESSQLWLQTQQEFFEWQQTIDQSRLQWDTAYKEQVKRTYEYYIEMTGLYADQIEKYNGLLGESYSETTLGIITNYDSMDEAQNAYTQKHEEYNYKLEENTKEWESVMDEECEKVGLDYGNLAKDVTDAANNIISENTQLESDVKNLKQVASDALGAMSKNVWSNVNSMISAIQALEAELQRAIALLQQLTQSSLGYDEGTDYSAYLTNDYMNYGGDKDKDEIRNWLDTYHYTDVLERMNAGDDRDIFSGKTYEEAADMIVDHIYNRFEEGAYDGWNFGGQESGKELIDYALEGMDQIYNKDKEHAATGGLFSRRTTTEIAENGPELVLNADDTKNILAAVSQMREVVRMKMQNLNGSLGKQTAGVTEKTVINKDVQQVEQAVHIDATFPNVSVAKEIEEAFSNLVNQAVQYASQDSRRH